MEKIINSTECPTITCWAHCIGWRTQLINLFLQGKTIQWKTKYDWFPVSEKDVRISMLRQMIDLHSVVAFFHMAKWTELAIMHEINRALGENTISDSTIGQYGRMLVCASKKLDTPIVPQSEGDCAFYDTLQNSALSSIHQKKISWCRIVWESITFPSQQ